MENLRSIGVFVRVVETGSFAAAANVLALTPSAVSKAIAALERSLNVRLLARSARGVRLTDEGARFHSRCRTIVAELAAAEREASGARAVPRGLLRVALHLSPARARILPNLPRFLQSHPDLRLDVTLQAGATSLDAKDIDVGVFVGDPPPDSNLVARRIADRHFLTCASRSYLERHGTPHTPDDLKNHNCLIHMPPTGRPQNLWTFENGETTLEVKVHGNLCINDGLALAQAGMAGHGILHFTNINIDPLLAANGGELVPLLTDWYSEAPPVQVMYARGRGASAKVRAFVDFVTALFDDVRPGARALPLARPPRQWPMLRA
jgi:LysR family transcriptional regulator for bpeEF and oprC